MVKHISSALSLTKDIAYLAGYLLLKRNERKTCVHGNTLAASAVWTVVQTLNYEDISLTSISEVAKTFPQSVRNLCYKQNLMGNLSEILRQHQEEVIKSQS